MPRHALMPEVITVQAGTKGFIDARGDPATARPTGYASIEWVCEEQPENMVDGDTLILVVEE